MKCNIHLSLCNIQRLTTQNFLIKVIFKALCRASFHLFLCGVILQTVAEYLASLSSATHIHAHALSLHFCPRRHQKQHNFRKKIHFGGNKERAERTCTHKLTDRPVAEKRRSRKEMEQGGVDQMVGGRRKK